MNVARMLLVTTAAAVAGLVTPVGHPAQAGLIGNGTNTVSGAVLFRGAVGAQPAVYEPGAL